MADYISPTGVDWETVNRVVQTTSALRQRMAQMEKERREAAVAQRRYDALQRLKSYAATNALEKGIIENAADLFGDDPATFANVYGKMQEMQAKQKTLEGKTWSPQDDPSIIYDIGPQGQMNRRMSPPKRTPIFNADKVQIGWEYLTPEGLQLFRFPQEPSEITTRKGWEEGQEVTTRTPTKPSAAPATTEPKTWRLKNKVPVTVKGVTYPPDSLFDIPYAERGKFDSNTFWHVGPPK